MADNENKSNQEPEEKISAEPEKTSAEISAKKHEGKAKTSNKASHAKKRKKHKKAKKTFWKALLTHPVTWIILAIIAMILFINHFERYTQIGVNTTYKIF